MKAKFLPKQEEVRIEKPYEFEDIQERLSLTETDAKRDQTTFGHYQDGKIDLAECIAEFMIHNKIRRKFFTNEHFEKWIISLGYGR